MGRWWLLFNLRVSYSSELGAARAYAGHANAVSNESHRRFVEQVERDELHHRQALLEMLNQLDARPWWIFEALFWCIGTCVGIGCHVWGDWASATGASWFEVNGEAEYRRLATAAQQAGEPQLVKAFKEMEHQEAEHRRLFAAMAKGASAEQLEDLVST